MKDDIQHGLNDLVGEILPPESSLVPSDKDLAIRFAIAELKYDAEERRRGQMYAFLTVLIIAAGTIYLVSIGHAVTGTIFSGSTSLAQIVNHFIAGSNRKSNRISRHLKTLRDAHLQHPRRMLG
ncbi:MAG TPA: hypothetical protein VNB54_04600, partial [Alphaproteobacteria bacterium]|nr:hypothetical protein [Alphaproteobacteria bacterium]